ncbi:hypothetical protein [Mycobacterium sp.]|uniref:hypothetical protein n=1 Tax=Mycobacterium sp. TaxID=1785 RepID=UPI003C7804CC
MRLLPHKMSAAEVDDALSKVSPDMVEKTFIIGTPDTVAAGIQRYIDAGHNKGHARQRRFGRT